MSDPSIPELLSRLREDPSYHDAWEAYVARIGEGGATGRFIRASLELAAGRYLAEDAEKRAAEFEAQYAACDPEVRELMAAYRSGLPTRFRVFNRLHIGHNPPREMFGYARTVAVGVLETGRTRGGMNLGVGVDSGGRPRRLQLIMTFQKNYDEVSAGREPLQVGIGWIGHLDIEPGRVLTEVQ